MLLNLCMKDSIPFQLELQYKMVITLVELVVEKDDDENKPRQNLVPLFHAFAKDFLRVSYIFWVNQEPYFKEDVLPCFSEDR